MILSPKWRKRSSLAVALLVVGGVLGCLPLISDANANANASKGHAGTGESPAAVAQSNAPDSTPSISYHELLSSGRPADFYQIDFAGWPSNCHSILKAMNEPWMPKNALERKAFSLYLGSGHSVPWQEVEVDYALNKYRPSLAAIVDLNHDGRKEVVYSFGLSRHSQFFDGNLWHTGLGKIDFHVTQDEYNSVFTRKVSDEEAWDKGLKEGLFLLRSLKLDTVAIDVSTRADRSRVSLVSPSRFPLPQSNPYKESWSRASRTTRDFYFNVIRVKSWRSGPVQDCVIAVSNQVRVQLAGDGGYEYLDPVVYVYGFATTDTMYLTCTLKSAFKIK